MSCGRSSLHIRLKGKGVKPVVSSTVQDGLIDFGYALVRDSSTMAFKVTSSSLPSFLSIFSTRLVRLIQPASDFYTKDGRFFSSYSWRTIQSCVFPLISCWPVCQNAEDLNCGTSYHWELTSLLLVRECSNIVLVLEMRGGYTSRTPTGSQSRHYR